MALFVRGSMDKAVDAVISVRVLHTQQILRNRNAMILPRVLYRVCFKNFGFEVWLVNSVCSMFHTLPEVNMWVKKNLEHHMWIVISLKC